MTVFLLQQLVNALTIGAIYALIALGYTMVYGTLRLINFAHGELFVGGAYVAIVAIAALLAGVASSVALPTALLIFAVSFVVVGGLGVAIERLAYRPLRSASRLAPILSALGVSLFLQNAIMLLAGPEPIVFPSLIERHNVELGPVVFSNINIVILVISIALMGLLTLFVKMTRIGIHIRVVAEDIATARLMGINIEYPILLVFFIGPGLGAVAGILYAMNYGVIHYGMGVTVGLKAFTAAILGGIGSIPGAVLGGFLIGVLETFGAGLLPILTHDAVGSEYRDVFAFTILVMVLLVRPGGILGQRYTEEHQVYRKDF